MPANKQLDVKKVNVQEILQDELRKAVPDADTQNDLTTAIIDTLFNVISSNATVYTNKSTAAGNNVVNAVRKDGSIASYEIKSPAVYEALVQSTSGSPDLIKGFSKISRGLVSLLTVKNPLFWLPNAIRDTQNLYTMGTETNPIKTTQNIGKSAFIKLFKRNDARYQAYLSMGGGQGQGISGLHIPKNSIDLKKSLIKGFHSESALGEFASWFRSASKAFESGGDFIEDNTRFAEFLGGIEKYGTDAAGKQLSFRRSRTVTTEFAVRGAKTGGLSSFFRFANAGIQGNVQQIRQLTDASTGSRTSKLIRSAALYGAGEALAEIFLRSLWGGEDEYEAIPYNVRATNWCIPFSALGLDVRSGDDYIRLPKPQGIVHAVLGNVPSAIAAGYMNGDLNSEIENAIWQVVDEVNVLDSPVWSPWADVLRNQTWYGTSIENASMEKTASKRTVR